MKFNILQFETIDSTNTEAAKHAKLGASEGQCIMAREQTVGRGRHGRTWVSGRDSGLYLSVVLRPKIEPRFIPLTTLMTGVAVHDALREFGVKSDIKWVNDLLVQGKKIGGILAETVETDAGLAIVVGIGINLKISNLPPEVDATATSVEQVTGRSVPAGEVADKITQFIDLFYTLLEGENGPAVIIDKWRKRSSYFSGKRVRVVAGDETLIGTTDGLEENGALRLKNADGSTMIVQAGDVELVRPSEL